jgi:hypothetical protein
MTTLIRYAHPRFIRLLRGTTPIETTQTFKPKKAALQAAGFDPRLTGGDDLFVRDAAARSFVPLSATEHAALVSGAVVSGAVVSSAVVSGAVVSDARRALD